MIPESIFKFLVFHPIHFRFYGNISYNSFDFLLMSTCALRRYTQNRMRFWAWLQTTQNIERYDWSLGSLKGSSNTMETDSEKELNICISQKTFSQALTGFDSSMLVFLRRTQVLSQRKLKLLQLMISKGNRKSNMCLTCSRDIYT